MIKGSQLAFGLLLLKIFALVRLRGTLCKSSQLMA